MCDNKEELVQWAKIAAQANRYDDMVQSMRKLVELGSELSGVERKLFVVAYKNVLSTRRTSWRVITSIEKKTQGSAMEQQLVREYRAKMETELRGVCYEMLYLLEKLIRPTSLDSESKVYYLKMKGDYHRYLAEVASGVARNAAVEVSKRSYQEAFDIARDTLRPTHRTRLEVALNLSVFHYEILGAPDNALQLAKKALCDARYELDTLSEDSDKEIARIVRWLRDIIVHWTAATVSDKPSDDVIKSLVETGLRKVKPNALKLEDIGAHLESINPAIWAVFGGQTHYLRKFLEEKCTSFVEIKIVDGKAVALYKPAPLAMDLQELARHFEVVYTEALRVRLIA